MTAIEELLTLLKEYELEHYEHEAPAAGCVAFFDGVHWHDCWESVGEEVNVTFSMTPEQAIEATLGPGTCHISVKDNLAETDGMGDVWLECDACGWQMPLEPSTPRFHFCPNCGRKVIG